MITENVSTLKIHKLSQTQYDRALAAGNIAENEIYLTPDDTNVMSSNNPVGTGSFSLNRADNSVIGDFSVAMGDYTTASGVSSVAMGMNTKASGDNSFAIGESTKASGYASCAEGCQTSATNDTAVEPQVTYETSNGYYAHAEGYGTVATGVCSHAEGNGTSASGKSAHADGCSTVASGDYSNASGYQTEAIAKYASAGGWKSSAAGQVAFTHGAGTTANAYQAVFGKYNLGHAGSSLTDQTATLFMIGNGYTTNDVLYPSNAFRITADGQTYGLKAFQASGADFAEYFEWIDGNPDNEDRRGRMVTLDGDKIRFANAEDDYLLGVVSTTGAFIGNSSSENWQGKYLKDVFGEWITEQVEVPESVDEETGEIIPAHTETHYAINPDYNPEEEYVSREFRKEWSPVGFHGQLVVVDDGTCEINSYCKPSENGIATASEDGYRVMSRLDDTHIKVLVK